MYRNERLFSLLGITSLAMMFGAWGVGVVLFIITINIGKNAIVGLIVPWMFGTLFSGMVLLFSLGIIDWFWERKKAYAYRENNK